MEQNLEDLEAAFQPGKDFVFDAIVQIQETNSTEHWFLFALVIGENSLYDSKDGFI